MSEKIDEFALLLKEFGELEDEDDAQLIQQTTAEEYQKWKTEFPRVFPTPPRMLEKVDLKSCIRSIFFTENSGTENPSTGGYRESTQVTNLSFSSPSLKSMSSIQSGPKQIDQWVNESEFTVPPSEASNEIISEEQESIHSVKRTYGRLNLSANTNSNATSGKKN